MNCEPLFEVIRKLKIPTMLNLLSSNQLSSKTKFSRIEELGYLKFQVEVDFWNF